jgi:hypothetical protein
MQKRALLLKQLEAVGSSLAQTDDALALLGLGSAGHETDRLDDYSDLDFFVVVREGCKAAFIESLSWLERVGRIAFAYRNTPDGHKVLFADGVFCEFAVFEPRELPGIPFAPGRVVWQREGFDASACAPVRGIGGAPHSAEWLLGEALTCLYVGLSRLRRGESLAAFRAIQVEAVRGVLELAVQQEPPQPGAADPFVPERRFEERFPGWLPDLTRFMQGYLRNGESALAILTFLEQRFEVNPAMASAIRALCEGEPKDT